MRIRSVLAAALLTAAPLLAQPAQSQAAADGCDPGVESDFNGDGRSDAVIADPGATIGGQAGAGRIIVRYGDGDLRVGEGAIAVLSEGSPGVGGVGQAGDGFGSALAVLDVNCDGYTDVAVGIPGQNAIASDVGRVTLIYGSAGGLGQGLAPFILSQSSFGQTARAGDRFGAALHGVEDVGQGGTPEPDAYVLAIGVPGAEVNGRDNSGAVAIIAPFDGGSERHWITQDTPGIPGTAESGDAFGSAVACNTLAGGPDIDCVVGSPGEDVGSKKNAGNAVMITDLYFVDEYTGRALGQNASGVPSAAETNNNYGASMATLQVGFNRYLAIGAPREGVGSRRNAGLVQMFNSNGSTLTPGAMLHQGVPGVNGTAEAGDRFGSSLAFLAPGLGDPLPRLVVGVPRENTGSGVDAGIIQLFTMTALTSDSIVHQGSPGVTGAARAYDRFGSAVSTVAGVNERVLLVGVPDNTTYTTGMVNVLPMDGNAPRAWTPSQGGAIPAGTSSRFGAVLGGVNGSSE